mgnify:CR=1 FL=1
MKKYVAEAVGTFGIVFCGTGAIIIKSGGSKYCICCSQTLSR